MNDREAAEAAAREIERGREVREEMEAAMPAPLLEAALTLHELKETLIAAGFTHAEALQIVIGVAQGVS